MADIKTETVTSGVFAGWVLADINDNFNALVGPYYYQADDPAKVKVGFQAEKRHLNGGGSVHGGCLLTLADTSLFVFAIPHLDGGGAVTVQLDAQFLAPGREGDIIVCSGEITRAGKSLIFGRGELRCEDRLLMSFTGILARKGPAGSRDG
ncbi:MAG TPA: PaaI family thioesterase [Asticcacaulis sp.]|nr:PaaI family thioesterase [Asticcacaulis sp.]